MVAVIGDIHGCFNTFKSLADQILKKYPGIELYSVGDLVDRGNFSYEVIEFVKSAGIKFTPGNHDFMMYYFIKYPTHEIGKPWLHNGYEPTLASYNDHFDKLNDHLEFIANQPLFYNLNECFTSHAGISRTMKNKLPQNFLEDTPKLEQILKQYLNSEEGIIWNRDILLNIGKLQVVGHTVKKEILFSEKSNAVYIDTGVYIGNKLSAVVVEDNKIVDSFSEITHKNDL